MQIPSYPAYPTNGGDLLTAPPKVGPWTWQPKVDDWHGVANPSTGQIWSQFGEPSSIAEKFDQAMILLKALPFTWLDVGLMQNRHDMMRGCIIVFDFIPTDGLRPTYADRRELLEPHFETLPFATDLLNVPQATGKKPCVNRVFLISHFPNGSETALYQTLKVQNSLLGKKFYEGVIAKRLDKPYPMSTGKPKTATPWQIKHRFDQ